MGSPLTPFYQFWGPKRGPGRSLFSFFFYLVFDMDFGTFFEQKTKKTKNEKVGFDCEKPYYREGRHVKKKGRKTGKKR